MAVSFKHEQKKKRIKYQLITKQMNIYKSILRVMVFKNIYFDSENYLYGHRYSFMKIIPKYQIDL